MARFVVAQGSVRMIPLGFPLHFLRPWWWLALLPLPFALWALARGGRGRAALARLADAALLPYLVLGARARQRAALALVAVAWLLGTAAMAGPAWQRVKTPLYVNGAARVVALSLSQDMLAEDLKPDRLVRARLAVRDLVGAAGDARVALIGYAGAAFTVAPLTTDKRTVLNLLRALKPDVMPVPGNDSAAGIRAGVQLLKDAHAKGGEIVLVTDTAGHNAVVAARAAHARGIRVDVLGIGTDKGAPIPSAEGGFVSGSNGLLLVRRDDAALRAVAHTGGGSYAVLPVAGGPTPTFAAPVAVGGHASRGEHARSWRDGGIWLLPALLVLGAVAFRRGWLLAGVVVLALPLAMPAAHAATWQSLWSNRDQRAQQALRRGDTQQARELATTPGMRGSADYRAGNYAGATNAFAQGSDARAHYNLGNALAKQGKFGQAIAAYRKALQRNPDMADARANLAAVEAWVKHHTTPSSRSGRAGRPSSRQRPGQGSSRAGKSGQGRRRSQSGAPASAPGSTRSARRSNANRAGGRRPGKPSNRGGASVGEQARQRQQAQRAARGLSRELRGSKRAAAGARSNRGPRSFALGQHESKIDKQLSAAQRALLRSVADDPGALLRRKFRLEWQQRSQGGGP
jgi:Ca-activated chloride channel family protein